MTLHLARRSLGLLIAFVFILSAVPPVMAGSVAVPVAPLAAISLSSSYSQDFNTLATSGTTNTWTDDSTISGWYSTRTVYIANAGTTTNGALYSFGTGTATERALGSIASGSTGTNRYGARFTNDTGNIVTSITVSYTGEQWRNGGNTTPHKLSFDYQVGGTVTSLTTGTWTPVTSLDFTGPIAVSTASALDGNAAANRVAISASFGVSIAAGQEIMLRWNDPDDTGSDHGLAVDDLTVTATGTVVDNPPTVSTTGPANGAFGVAVNAPVTVAFSEPVTFSGPVAIVCTSGTQPATPTGSGTAWSLPHTDFAAGDVCTITIPANQVTDQDGTLDNMAADYSWSFVIQGTSKIHAIQGSGSAAVLSTFSVEAIVTGDFQGVTGVDDFKLDGFFVQEENADADANPATSEGIFVFCQTCSTNVVVGDKVQVTGTSSEYFNMSQLNATTAGSVVVVSGGNTLPTPSAITLPVPGVTATDLAGAQTQINAYYEPFEGMLVQIGAPLSVTEYFELFRYGQLVLAQGGRFRQFTDGNAPSTTGYIAHQIDLAKRKVILDDDSNQQNHALAENPDIPVFHPVPGFSTTNYVRGGDTITNLTGVLHWSFAGQSGTDAWRIRPVTSAFSYAFTPANPRTAAPAAVGGNLQVGSFNTLNFFTTIDTTSSNTTGPCAPSGTQDCRGADSAVELTQQRTKLIAAICALDADVLGLMELENPNPSNDPAPGDGIADYVLKDLVDAINAPGSSCPDKTYAFTDGTAAGTDAIRVGIIYKTSSVTPIGTPVVLIASDFTDPNNTGTPKSRPALAQTFEDNTWGERFTIVANHLKSKGSCPTTTPLLDTDQSDGQGCWNDTRQKAASYLVNTWLLSDPTASGDPDFLVVGDLNAYRLEAPITNIIGAGYTNLINTYAGGTAYGYLFDGQLGYLDHALSAAALTPQVTGATEWHINADEVNLLDYNDTVQDPSEAIFDAKPTATNLYNADAYRSTDHDPVLVGLGLYPDQGDLASSYGAAWHTGQGALRLGLLWTGEATSTPGGDTGDDGVTIDTSDWRRGGTTAATAVVTRMSGSGNAWLAGWADWNNNGSFADAGELIVNGSVTVGSNTFSSILIPVDAVVGVPVNMRFRLYDSLTEPAALAPLAVSPSGRGNGGEVEDQSIQSIPLAVLLAGFDASPQGDAILVTWDTVSELNNQGFNLYRGGSPTAPETLLGYLPSQAPGSGAGASYQWLDEGLATSQTFYYWLEAVDLSGATTLHGPVSATTQSPTAVTLSGLEAGSRPGTSAGWIGAVLFLVIGLASVVFIAERRQRHVR